MARVLSGVACRAAAITATCLLGFTAQALYAERDVADGAEPEPAQRVLQVDGPAVPRGVVVQERQEEAAQVHVEDAVSEPAERAGQEGVRRQLPLGGAGSGPSLLLAAWLEEGRGAGDEGGRRRTRGRRAHRQGGWLPLLLHGGRIRLEQLLAACRNSNAASGSAWEPANVEAMMQGRHATAPPPHGARPR